MKVSSVSLDSPTPDGDTISRFSPSPQEKINFPPLPESPETEPPRTNCGSPPGAAEVTRKQTLVSSLLQDDDF